MTSSNGGARDWRDHLSIKSREKIVKRIMENLRSNILPKHATDEDLLKIALQFEQKTHDIATDQQDYLRRIVEKMRMLEVMAESSQSNHTSSSAASSSATSSSTAAAPKEAGSPQSPTKNRLLASKSVLTENGGHFVNDNYCSCNGASQKLKNGVHQGFQDVECAQCNVRR